jgi:hypothetical protein
MADNVQKIVIAPPAMSDTETIIARVATQYAEAVKYARDLERPHRAADIADQIIGNSLVTLHDQFEQCHKST